MNGAEWEYFGIRMMRHELMYGEGKLKKGYMCKMKKNYVEQRVWKEERKETTSRKKKTNRQKKFRKERKQAVNGKNCWSNAGYWVSANTKKFHDSKVNNTAKIGQILLLLL